MGLEPSPPPRHLYFLAPAPERGASLARLKRPHPANRADVSRHVPVEGLRFVPPLTARERQVLTALAHGLTNPQIAARLHISIDCVKYHLKNLYLKLGASRRAQAVRIAAQSGLY